jgi:hypothetical protein
MASFQSLIDRIDQHESFIGEKFDTLGDKVSKIDRTLAAHIAVEVKTTNDSDKFNAEVKKALWGNGKPGLTDRVKTMELFGHAAFWVATAIIVPSVGYTLYIGLQSLAHHFGWL